LLRNRAETVMNWLLGAFRIHGLYDQQERPIVSQSKGNEVCLESP
jgi:hypothetical protein